MSKIIVNSRNEFVSNPDREMLSPTESMITVFPDVDLTRSLVFKFHDTDFVPRSTSNTYGTWTRLTAYSSSGNYWRWQGVTGKWGSCTSQGVATPPFGITDGGERLSDKPYWVVAAGDMTGVTACHGLFKNCHNLVEIVCDLAFKDLVTLTDSDRSGYSLHQWFVNCYALVKTRKIIANYAPYVGTPYGGQSNDLYRCVEFDNCVSLQELPEMYESDEVHPITWIDPFNCRSLVNIKRFLKSVDEYDSLRKYKLEPGFSVYCGGVWNASYYYSAPVPNSQKYRRALHANSDASKFSARSLSHIVTASNRYHGWTNTMITGDASDYLYVPTSSQYGYDLTDYFANCAHITKLPTTSLVSIITYDGSGSTTKNRIDFAFAWCYNVTNALESYQAISSISYPSSNSYQYAYAGCGVNTAAGRAQLLQIPSLYGGGNLQHTNPTPNHEPYLPIVMSVPSSSRSVVIWLRTPGSGSPTSKLPLYKKDFIGRGTYTGSNGSSVGTLYVFVVLRQRITKWYMSSSTPHFTLTSSYQNQSETDVNNKGIVMGNMDIAQGTFDEDEQFYFEVIGLPNTSIDLDNCFVFQNSSNLQIDNDLGYHLSQFND